MQLMKGRLKHHNRKLMACLVALIMLLSTMGLGSPGTAWGKTEESDPADHFEVWLVDPANSSNKMELVNYTIAELEQMPQVQRAYSSIDSLPAPVFTAAKGIDLIDFLQNHKFAMDTVTKFKFRATDFDNDNLPPSFGKVLQASDLLNPDRYYFPKIEECWDEYWDEGGENPSNSGVPGYWEEGSDPYTRADQELVRPMLGIISYQARAITSDPGKPIYTEPQFGLMDGTTALRLCYGQKDPGECITFNFLKWTYKMEVTGKLLPMALSPDTTGNSVGSPIEITFADNLAWQNGITAVSVGDSLLGETQYMVTPGKITIAAGVFNEAGTYTVKVSSGFNDSTVEQEITAGASGAAPPLLTADTSDNTVGNPVEIGFTDDAAWRDAITEIKVNDTLLTTDQYSISAGKITIAASVFTTAGTYMVAIKATGYGDATLLQIIKDLLQPAILQRIAITKPADKLVYIMGEDLDITGLEVTGYYNDDSSQVETITTADISGFDSSQPAAGQILTITIGEKTATYAVTITQPVTAVDNGTINVTPDIPLTITLPPGVTNTGIGITQKTALPLIKIESDQVDMTIANGTTVTGSDAIQLPEIKPSSSVDIPMALTVDLVIEVGSNTNSITFSQPVRLVLKGQGAKSVSFIDTDGNFQAISRPASLRGLTGESDVDEVAKVFKEEELQHGAVASGPDLIIWTEHFTTLVAYTPFDLPPLIIIPEIIEEIIEFDEVLRTQTISSRGGIIKIAGAMFAFPANAVSEDIEVSIKRLSKNNIPLVPTGFTLLGQVFEVTTDKTVTFNKPVTITLPFDSDEVNKEKYDVGIYCWGSNQWVILEQVKVNLETGKVSGTVNHFSIFAVLLTEKSESAIDEEKEPVQEVFAPVKAALKDISGHWAEANISRLVEAGAVGGYPGGCFEPDNTITRAEFAAILVNAFKLEPKSGEVFNDTSGHWARDSIKTAAANGIVSGYSENSFGPNDPITRQQMAVMISRVANLSDGEGKTFADSNQIADWAQAAVAAVSGGNIISGYPDNTFRPQAYATRAEAVTVIVKALH